MRNKRVFLIVLDSFGIGNAPDAKNFGDEGANTLKSLHNLACAHFPRCIPENCPIKHSELLQGEAPIKLKDEV